MRGLTASLVTWLTLDCVANSDDPEAYIPPFSNCKYPTGVSVAGVATVGRPGLHSGVVSELSCALAMVARGIKMIARSAKEFLFNEGPFKSRIGSNARWQNRFHEQL